MVQSKNSITTIRNGTDKDNISLRHVDLNLPNDKIPTDLNTFQTTWLSKLDTIEGHVNTKDFIQYPNKPSSANKGIVMQYAIGSSSQTDVSYRCTMGLFECIKEVWANHWNLRTSPEDWWFPIACQIARAIDKAVKPSLLRKAKENVRDFFVSHQGQETIAIKVNVWTIYDINYDELFSIFSDEIRDRIKVPEFVMQMQHDFSTTTTCQQIASNVNVMAAVQSFFKFEVLIAGCGIKGLEMLGTKADWDHLVDKLLAIEDILRPISSDIGLSNEWFRHVEYVFRYLARSYSNPESTEVHNFWTDILCVGKDWKYGSSGNGKDEVDAYNGWLIKFLIGKDSLLKENFLTHNVLKELSGMNSVPMTLTFTYRIPPISDESELHAGIMGFVLIEPESTFNHVPSLQPNHMWAMMLPPQSPLRNVPK